MAHDETCAEVISRTLYDAGVRYAFGHPGGEVVELIDALHRRGIEFILTGHETTAAFMAGTVGRLTGIPGVCIATLGPGACNLVLGVGSAYLDRDPLLAITARTASHRIHRSNKQNLPLNTLFEPITKWSVALNGGALAETIESALMVASTPPRGSVYLTIPADVATASPTEAPSITPPAQPVEDHAELETIIQHLNTVRRPIGVIGPALDSTTDTPAVRRFFKETGIPYVITVQGKGIADETGSRFLGSIAPAAGEKHIIEWLQQSDFLLGIGFDPIEISQVWHFDAPLHIIANGPVDFGDFQPPTTCVGDVSVMIDQVGAAYQGDIDWSGDEILLLRQRVDEAYRPKVSCSAQGISPYHLITVLRDVLPEDTIISSDVGAHKNVIGQRWRAPEPGTFLMSNGLSSMGYGPASIMAAALIHPERPVVSITGDGAFAMMVQELETVRRMKTAPLFVVLCDASLAVIKVAQKLRDLPLVGVDFMAVDWVKVAEGFGVRGEAVNTLGSVRIAVQDWLNNREPMVLAVKVDEALYTGLRY